MSNLMKQGPKPKWGCLSLALFGLALAGLSWLATQ